MDIDETIKSLETLKQEKERLATLEKAAYELPRTPPGFADGAVERVQWTSKWVKDNWHAAEGVRTATRERDTEKRRADAAEARIKELESALATVRDCMPNVKLCEEGGK